MQCAVAANHSLNTIFPPNVIHMQYRDNWFSSDHTMKEKLTSLLDDYFKANGQPGDLWMVDPSSWPDKKEIDWQVLGPGNGNVRFVSDNFENASRREEARAEDSICQMVDQWLQTRVRPRLERIRQVPFMVLIIVRPSIVDDTNTKYCVKVADSLRHLLSLKNFVFTWVQSSGYNVPNPITNLKQSYPHKLHTFNWKESKQHTYWKNAWSIDRLEWVSGSDKGNLYPGGFVQADYVIHVERYGIRPLWFEINYRVGTEFSTHVRLSHKLADQDFRQSKAWVFGGLKNKFQSANQNLEGSLRLHLDYEAILIKKPTKIPFLFQLKTPGRVTPSNQQLILQRDFLPANFRVKVRPYRLPQNSSESLPSTITKIGVCRMVLQPPKPVENIPDIFSNVQWKASLVQFVSDDKKARTRLKNQTWFKLQSRLDNNENIFHRIYIRHASQFLKGRFLKVQWKVIDTNHWVELQGQNCVRDYSIINPSKEENISSSLIGNQWLLPIILLILSGGILYLMFSPKHSREATDEMEHP